MWRGHAQADAVVVSGERVARAPTDLDATVTCSRGEVRRE